MPLSVEHQLTLVQAQLQQLTAAVGILTERLPESGRQWIPTGEMAALAGCSTRTLQLKAQAGRFPAGAVRQVQRGTRTESLFHRQKVLEALDAGC